MPRKSRVFGLAAAFAVAASAFAAGAAPPPRVEVSEWAEKNRHVAAESGSSYPGKWRNDLAPYLVEPMDCLALHHPAREVTFKKGAQLGASEAFLNAFGAYVDTTPCPILVVLPSLENRDRYVELKLQPAIDATPALAAKVKNVKSRDADGSTKTLKKFRGGWCLVTGANSSKDLQMISVRVVDFEEISEYPWDVDGRGDPVDLADARTDAWRGREKKFFNSTPGIKGSCRVSAKYEASDQRRLYVPCPHANCGDYHELQWKNLQKDSPATAVFFCPSCGASIEHHHKRVMVGAGVWLKCYPGTDENPRPPEVVAPADLERWRARSSAGRQPGFFLWQAYSPFKTWGDIVAKFVEVKDDPAKFKVFTQQVLGETWEEKGEAPAVDLLLLRREHFAWQRIPPGCLFLTAAADVQGNRVEYDVFAWKADLSSWRIDGGVIEGNPDDLAFWLKLDPIVRRQYEDARGRLWPIDAFGFDTGYLSQKVYHFVRRHASSGRVYALDGRGGWGRPAIGTPRKVDIDFAGRKVGVVMLWPVGTYGLKSELYRGLEMTLRGADDTGTWPAGAAHFEEHSDRPYFEQLTAEYLKDVPRTHGLIERVWAKDSSQPNERHDIAVYARALAHHIADNFGAEEWANLAASRGAAADQVQKDLAAFWAPPAELAAQQAAAVAASSRSSSSDEGEADDFMGGRGRDFFSRREED